MSVWGHDFVHIVKDVVKRQWVVQTAKIPHQHLVTIPWTDAFRHIVHEHAPDYTEALATCLSNEKTALTEAEERLVREEMEDTPPRGRKAPMASPPETVVSLDEYRRRKKPR